MDTYDPQAIEAKWQRVWEDARAFYVDDPPPGAEPDDKFYQLEMLPYPSGNLHMGHVLNYTLGDVVTHFQRRHGKQVLRPMGWDSFGLPAENAAINEGGHPREIVERNIDNIERQMHRLGWAIDWDRVIAAHDPAYYRWTQWLFLRFLEQGLAYRKEAAVNWCPHDQTVLANEQVVNGHCERCGTAVEVRKLEQWFFRITAYADALLRDHELIDWPERTKTIQRNWIGRSEGAELLFRIDELDEDVPVFTTRPDTVFGATFFVLAPEHPLVEELVDRSPNGAELGEYVSHGDGQARRGTGLGRGQDRRLHRLLRRQPGDRRADPGLGRRLRADGVRHRRDHGGARTRRARPRVRRAPRAAGRAGYRRGGAARWSIRRSSAGCRSRRRSWRSSSGWASAAAARPAVSFRLRDWGFSRQRYWGCADPGRLLRATAGSSPFRTTSCPCCCPRWTTTGRRASRRWPRTRSG